MHMEQLLDLANDPPSTVSNYLPVEWSGAAREALLRTTNGEDPQSTLLDKHLALALLKCEAGNFIGAQADIAQAFRDNARDCAADSDVFHSFLRAFFVSQRLDMVAAMLCQRHQLADPIEIRLRADGPGTGRVAWEIEPSGAQNFTFHSQILTAKGELRTLRQLDLLFPLISNYQQSADRETGSVLVNLWDRGVSPGLAFSDNRPDYFLIPDNLFVSTLGYARTRHYFRENPVAWSDRRPVALWRGSTTGARVSLDRWQSLDRIKLCELARKHKETGLIDAGISKIAQFTNPDIVREIEASGLMSEFIHWQKWIEYKFHIDIDGNSNSWQGLLQKLLTGSPVLKVQSAKGMQQWYYDELIPWHNYVPVAADMSDLMDKIAWLRDHDSYAQRLGIRGAQLATALSYTRELKRSIPVITAAFRYSRGLTEGVGPHGRTEHEPYRTNPRPAIANHYQAS